MHELILAVSAAVVYLVAGLALFLFGSSYYSLFWTNRAWVYRAALPLVAGLIAWGVHRAGTAEAVRLLSVAFLAATTANLAGWAVAHLWRPLGLGKPALRDVALQKLLEAVAVVGAILLVLALTRTDPSLVYLSAGRLSLGLAVGWGGFALFAVLALLQTRTLKISRIRLVQLLPWILIFCFSNAFMEELWFRGLFLQPLATWGGVGGASLLTGVVFAVAHVGATYMSKEERLRFLIILLPLGVAWALAMYYTRSLLASTLFHAGADLIVIRWLLPAMGEAESERDGGSAPT